MRMNGHSHPAGAPDPTPILVQQIAEMRGEVRAEFRHINRRLDHISRPRRPLTEYITPAIGAIILAVAAAGKITWQEALPSLLGLVGR